MTTNEQPVPSSKQDEREPAAVEWPELIGVWIEIADAIRDMSKDPRKVLAQKMQAYADASTAERDAVIVRLVDQLFWALDLVDMYEHRLIDFGDPKEKVLSNVQIQRKFKARTDLEYAWQMLHENSPCRSCESGNIPLNGWHKYADGDQPCQK